ncbi:hypothetical protein HCN44_011410 [Aphidius gifuensis]|uniref:Exosome complex component 10 homolog n=1 Tax=Aphidius gifuensis TaxID=684658 RepID=A0A834Y0A3_APHGI|nr:hypothetical protein HCN44_011410 [Aphidius gifuensis]
MYELLDSVQKRNGNGVNYAYCGYGLNKKNYGVFHNNFNYGAPNYQWMNNNVGRNRYIHPNNKKNRNWKNARVTSSFSPASSQSSSPTQTWTSPPEQSVATAQQVIPHGNGAESSDRMEIIKPQLLFQDKIDNSSGLWMPKLTEKPNAIEPLLLNVAINKNGKCSIHPYKVELEKFEIAKVQFDPCSIKRYKNINDTDMVFVQTHSDLISLVEKLMKCREIAIDLEHHSNRSYQGITCLMQISTRNTDYLIDTLSLRSDLHVLNKIFTNPKVLKVLHGADNDILWLQRDLSLYIVNMFDTHQAAIALDIPPGKRSFSSLLSTYCNIQTDKQYQLADWRIRPLPKELVEYSRMDTHFLLYIKDVMSNKLLLLGKGQELLKSVYQKSTNICKTVYKKPICDDNSFKRFYRKSGKKFNEHQLCALKLMYYWRDKIARQEDDSVEYVLPNNMMISIAEKLPNSIEGIYECCTSVPPLVLKNIIELYSIIVDAKCDLSMSDEPLNVKENITVKSGDMIKTMLSYVWPKKIIDKVSRGINFVSTAMVFKVVPTVFELSLVSGILGINCGSKYAAVAFSCVGIYFFFTLAVTQWKKKFY